MSENDGPQVVVRDENWPQERPPLTLEATTMLRAGADNTWRCHPTCEISPFASVEPGVTVWGWTHVRERAYLAGGVSIGENCYIAEGVCIGTDSRIGNGVSVWRGVKIRRRVFVGPHVVFTNDPHPVVGNTKWEPTETVIEDDVSIGAGARILCGITIGKGAKIGMGATVTQDVAPGETWRNEPARMVRRGAE